MREALEAKASKAERQNERVQRARLSETLPGLLYYLYWRNRYPILTKIVSRALLFIELYLVYKLFSVSAASALSIVIFLVFIGRGVFQGITQYFRLKMIKAEQERKSSVLSLLNLALQKYSLFYGVLAGVVILTAALTFANTQLSFAFAAPWAILLPLQLSTTSYWVAVYTKRRLRRSFFVIIACRLMPIFALLVFAPIISVYSYPLGILVGRGLEQYYLRNVARRDLVLDGAVSDIVVISNRYLAKFLFDADFWRRLLASSAFYFFQLCVGLAIFSQEYQIWFTHFAFFIILATSSFIPLRIPTSLGMDLYLALKSGSVIRSRQLIRITRTVLCVCLLILSAGFIFLLVLNTSVLTASGGVVYSLFIYFITLFIVRSWFQSEFMMARTSALETAKIASLCLLFIATAGIGEFYLISFYSANLPMVYAVESAVFLIASFGFALSLKPEKSEIYLRTIRIRKERVGVLSPANWMEATKNTIRSNRELEYFVVQLDARHSSLHRAGALFEKLRNSFAFKLNVTEVIPSIFLISVVKENRAKFAEVINSEYAGHVRNLILLEKERSLETNLKRVLKACQRVREVPKPLKSSRGLLNELLKSGKLSYIKELEPLCRELNSKDILIWISSFINSDLSCAWFDGKRLRQVNKPSLPCVRAAHRMCLVEGGVKMLAPLLRSPLVSISIFSRPLAVVDTKNLSSEQIKLLYQASLLISLASTTLFQESEEPFRQAV